MQVGRVVVILPDTLLDTLLHIISDAKNEELLNIVESAKKTVFIDDLRPEKIGSLPE